MELDPQGHTLLTARLARLPELLDGMLHEPPVQLHEKARRARRFVITGTGSSEAHARFLLHLLNRSAGRAAEFRPLSAFCAAAMEPETETCLIVISQGLSPNAQVAVLQRTHFVHTILFTSSTPTGAFAAGKPDKARLLEQLQEEGADLLLSPLEEEYSTLIRFIGPMAVYLRVWQFVRALEPGCLPPISARDLRCWLHRTESEAVSRAFLAHVDDFRRGFYLLAVSPLCEFAHNLSYKFLEGVYWSAPVVWDFLQFAHGPFQEVTLQPRPVVVLETPGAAEANLAQRTRKMLEAVSIPCLTLKSTSSGPEAIFEYEAMFNHLVMRLIRELAIDQRNWPSKGRDDPLYGFHRVD